MTLHALPAPTPRAAAPSPRPRPTWGRDAHGLMCDCHDPAHLAAFDALMADVQREVARRVVIRRPAPIAPKVWAAGFGAFWVSFAIVMVVLLLGAAGAVPVAFPGSHWTQGLVAVLLTLGPALGAGWWGYRAEHQARPGDAEMAAERLAG